jgi:hypothetical protein
MTPGVADETVDDEGVERRGWDARSRGGLRVPETWMGRGEIK